MYLPTRNLLLNLRYNDLISNLYVNITKVYNAQRLGFQIN